MLEFLNNWIYTTDLTGDLKLLKVSGLPITWNDPVSGNSHSNFPVLGSTDISAMNNIGWYRILENIVIPTPYQKIVLSSRVFDNQTSEFTDVYTIRYKDIETIRNIKLSEVNTEKINTIESHFDYLTDTEKFHTIYKSIGLLIQSFSEIDPQIYVNNNTYLQTVLGRVNAMDIDVSECNSRISKIKTETDLQKLILL